MSLDRNQLHQLIAAVPTTDLSISEMDVGKPAIFANGNPIFRCRTNEEGEAYAQLVVKAIGALPALLGESAQSATMQPESASEASSAVVSEAKAAVIASLTNTLSMQREFKANAKLWSSLLYAAVEPFLAGAAGDLQQAPVSSTPVSLPDTAGIRSQAVQEFCSWLVEDGHFNSIKSEQDLDELNALWEEQHNA